MRNSKPLLPLLAILPVLLAGCATAPSDISTCPPIVEYDAAFLARAAEELAEITTKGYSALPQMIVDYGRTRDMLRACH